MVDEQHLLFDSGCSSHRDPHAHPDADPAGRTIRSPDDDGADVRHLYAADEHGALIGAPRLRLWRPGELPQAARASFQLDVFPEVDRYSVGEISNLVVSPAARSHEVGRRLRGTALILGVHEIGMQVLLGRCPLDRIPFWPPPAHRGVADWAAKRALELRRSARGDSGRIADPRRLNLGNLLGRLVDEGSGSDRDYRRDIDGDLWRALSADS